MRRPETVSADHRPKGLHTLVAHAGEPYTHPAAPPATAFALPTDFWSHFRNEHWERRGAVIEQPFGIPLATPDDTFDCLVAAGDRYRDGDPGVPLEFCVEHARQLADVGRYLPERSDGSAAGYAERVTRLLGGRKFGLVVDDFQLFNATLWLRLREFLRGLFELTGLPGDSAKATLFLGNYDSTPFGLHRGHSSNFMFVVEGQKRMRTWPDAFFRDKENLTNRLDYHHYDGSSIVLDGLPGDVIYWPSDAWHIGENVDGGLSCAISIALFMEHRPSADLLGIARGMVERKLKVHAGTEGLFIRPSGLADGQTAIDHVVTRATSALREASSEPELERRLRLAWLNHLTGFGFTTTPAPRLDISVTADTIVHGTPDYPIVWMRTDHNEIACSANGHAFSMSASPRIISLLALLNRGESHRVGDLMAQHAGSDLADAVEFETTEDDVQRLIEKLASLRAVVTSLDS